MLSGLIQKYDSISEDLLAAVGRGQDEKVQVLDGCLQDLIRRIFDVNARTQSDISEQIGFFKRLADSDYEDSVSVRRYTSMMSSLFCRYLEAESRRSRALPEPPMLVEGYDPTLHEIVLDLMPERVAVIGRDYRYIYCNAPNAAFHGKRPSDFIGKHLLDVIDQERFECRARPRLDQCFSGAQLAYEYEVSDARGRMFEVLCRMTPLPGADNTIAGALIAITMEPTFARTG